MNKPLPEQMQLSFLGIINHELTNFVSNIQGAIELLKLELPSSDQTIQNYLNICTKSINQILPFIKEINTYSHLQNYGLDSKPTVTNVIDTITSSVNKYLDSSKPVKVLLDITNLVPKEILIDNLNLFKVLNIIVSNAFRFTEKGHIYIKATTESSQLIIKVEDTGKGMCEEQLKNSFYNNDNAIETIYRKFSLKLSIAKKIIESLNGELSIASKLNVGTEVIIKLPFTPIKSANDTSLSGDNNFLINNVLVIEDNLTTKDLIAAFLKRLNFASIDTAGTGLEGITLAEKNNYDLIFMDITLPDISGIEATQRIKRQLKKNIPIVAVTSHFSEVAFDDLLSQGFLYIIPKPISANSFEQFFKDLPFLIQED